MWRIISFYLIRAHNTALSPSLSLIMNRAAHARATRCARTPRALNGARNAWRQTSFIALHLHTSTLPRPRAPPCLPSPCDAFFIFRLLYSTFAINHYLYPSQLRLHAYLPLPFLDMTYAPNRSSRRAWRSRNAGETIGNGRNAGSVAAFSARVPTARAGEKGASCRAKRHSGA